MPFSARLYDTADDTPAPRSRTHLSASMTPSTREPHHIVVHNLSPEGLLAESYYEMPVGSEVEFEIADLGTVKAKIVWRDGRLYDCLFTVPLSEQLVHSKLRQSNVVWGNFPGQHSLETEALLSLRGRIAPPSSGERWPLLARVSLIVGAAATGWFAIIGFTMLLSKLF